MKPRICCHSWPECSCEANRLKLYGSIASLGYYIPYSLPLGVVAEIAQAAVTEQEAELQAANANLDRRLAELKGDI